MASIKRFEDLDCWKKSRQLCQEIYEVADLGSFARDFALKDQVLRSSGSVMDNIAEGFERGGNKELIQFLFIAKASCGEVKSQIYRAKDRNHINEAKFNALYDLASQTSKLIIGFISYLHNSEKKGYKYRD